MLKSFWFRHHLRDPVGRIIQITDKNGLPLAADDTERFKPLVYSMSAEIAFFGLFLFLVKNDGVIGTDLQADSAAIAFFVFQKDQSVFSFYEGFDGTCVDTRRVFTMVL